MGLSIDRSKNESVFIHLPDSRKIRLTITRCSKDRTRIEFNAPQDIKILRDDIIDKRPELKPIEQPEKTVYANQQDTIEIVRHGAPKLTLAIERIIAMAERIAF